MMAAAKAVRRRLRRRRSRRRPSCCASCSTTSSSSPTTRRTSTPSPAPDFVMGPTSDPATRNLIGVIRKVGLEIGGQVIKCRQWGHEAAAIFGGQPVNPINAIPGGMSKGINAEERDAPGRDRRASWSSSPSSRLRLFHDVVLGEQRVRGPDPERPLHPRDLLDGPGGREEPGQLLRRQGARGRTRRARSSCKYAPADYAKHVAERVEPWTYLKFPYLKKVGWKGFVDGKDSGVYRATPQSRLNVADGMATPLAQAAYEEYFETLTGDRSGRKPVHHTLAIHWARLVELLNAAERALELRAAPRDHPPRELPRASRPRRPARAWASWRRRAARSPTTT